MNVNLAIILNVGLRGGVLVGKFFFVFVAAKYLPLEDLGIYSLIGAVVSYALYLLGMGFFSFATREIIGIKESEQASIILDLFRFYVISFLVFFVPLMSVFQLGLLDWKWALLFYPLLFCEHISQELTRLIIALGNPLQANFLLFLRTASWAYLALLVFYLDPAMRTIELVLYLWLATSALSLFVGFWLLRFVPWRGFFKRPLPLKWIFQGLKIAFPFLISALAFRAIFTLDRYAVEWIDGLAMVGVYTVYFGLCNGMVSFMDAAVFQFTYPRLVEQVKSRDRECFRQSMINFCIQVLGCVFLCVSGLVVFVGWTLELLDKPEYLNYIPALWWLLVAHVLLMVSYVPHYGLYALKQDRWILLGHVIPLTVFLVALWVLDLETGLMQVAVGLVFAFSSSLLVKTVGFVKPYVNFMKAEDGLIHV